MKSPSAALALFLFVFCECAHAMPPAGRYAGMLKVTKHVDGLTATVNVRAFATVGPEGSLTIVLATMPSPLPDATNPSDVLRTTISAELSCVIPGKPLTPSATASTPSDPGNPSHIIFTATLPIPVFRGAIQVNANRFSLQYTDVPTNYVYAIAPRTFTDFSYTFHRVADAGFEKRLRQR
jgi:hypothetical protein